MKCFVTAAIAIVLGSSSSPAATLHVDDFQAGTSTLGWQGGASPTYVANGGPSGAGDGSLQISTPAGGHLAAYNLGANWTGSLTAAGATAITVDMMSPQASAPLSMRAVLFGPGSTTNRWTTGSAQAVPNDGVWRSYTFSLSAAELVRASGSGTHAQLMTDTVRVMLRYDTGTPSATGPAVPSPGGTLYLDNIALVGVPEPGGARLALVLGLPAVWFGRRRRANAPRQRFSIPH
ncbi:MAG: hypothetical protein IT424_03900 [Pirellulales bacterium]|nr:hypothetical protein [Pirellulales bacterium]